VEHVHGYQNLPQIDDEPHGKMDNDRADSSVLFAGRTLVLRR
jgi:hypothetical protein